MKSTYRTLAIQSRVPLLLGTLLLLLSVAALLALLSSKYEKEAKESKLIEHFEVNTTNGYR